MKRVCIVHNFIHPLHTRLHALVKLSSGRRDVWCSVGPAIRLLDIDNRRKFRSPKSLSPREGSTILLTQEDA